MTPDEQQKKHLDDLKPKAQTPEQSEQVKGGYDPIDSLKLQQPIRTIDVPNG